MLTRKQINRGMELDFQLGRNPTAGLCDRSWSPSEWAEYQARLGEPVISKRREKYVPEFKIVKGRYEIFRHPNQKAHRRLSVPVVEDRLGRESPLYHPIDIKTGRPYDDQPF